MGVSLGQKHPSPARVPCGCVSSSSHNVPMGEWNICRRHRRTSRSGGSSNRFAATSCSKWLFSAELPKFSRRASNRWRSPNGLKTKSPPRGYLHRNGGEQILTRIPQSRTRRSASVLLLSHCFRRCRWSPNRPPLLKTLAAVDWAPLCGLERHRRFFPALRANGLRFYALHGRRSSRAGPPLRARRLTRFAAFRLVLEAFVREEHLFAGGKHKLRTAFGALQYLIVEFHGRSGP